MMRQWGRRQTQAGLLAMGRPWLIHLTLMAVLAVLLGVRVLRPAFHESPFGIPHANERLEIGDFPAHRRFSRGVWGGVVRVPDEPWSVYTPAAHLRFLREWTG